VSGASRLTLEPGTVNVTDETGWEVTPAATTRYTLTASNAAGSVEAETTVNVEAVEVSLDTVAIASGLAQPVAITHAGDGSGRLFITLQGGQIVIFDGERVLPEPFLDIVPLVSCCGERGLLSVAFHPDYEHNGLFYVNYTDVAGDTVVARYHVTSDPNSADPGSAVTVLTVTQPFANHNGGQLKFGPDGYLYIGMGDGGSGGDPLDHGQDVGTLLGAMLRIDVAGSPYAIPADNPFVGDPEAREEIWAYGLRNPWRFSFDRETGDLFIADVGQNRWEEVNLQPANSAGGENYGWRLMEASHCHEPSENCDDGSLVLPVLEYETGENCSVIGGYRYRGGALPELTGTYIFGDYCSGRIWGAVPAGEGWTSRELLKRNYRITAFGEDEAGELYVADLREGGVYRLVSGNR
jgi:glucose/arabinose dehydrogenase